MLILYNTNKGGDNINDLIIIIKKVLNDNFSEIYVYSEESEAFNRPYFFVKILNSNKAKGLNRRYKRTITFEINYASDKENFNEDYLTRADELYELLEIVELDGEKFRALNMNHEVKDKILYFRFELETNLLKNTEENGMKELEVDVGGK